MLDSVGFLVTVFLSFRLSEEQCESFKDEDEHLFETVVDEVL